MDAKLGRQALHGATDAVARRKIFDLRWAEFLVRSHQRRPLCGTYALTCDFDKMILVPINGE